MYDTDDENSFNSCYGDLVDAQEGSQQMTTNNEVKAPRPCTLWGKTFDSNTPILHVENTIVGINELTFRGQTIIKAWQEIVLACSPLVEVDVNTDYSVSSNAYVLETIQAIASAQRPWLKAEGFEFDDNQHSLYDLIVKDSQDNNEIKIYTQQPYIELDCNDFGHGYNGFDVCGIEDIIAFKPCIHYDPTDTPQQRLAKEQEAWDAVAGVEVWGGV